MHLVDFEVNISNDEYIKNGYLQFVNKLKLLAIDKVIYYVFASGSSEADLLKQCIIILCITLVQIIRSI